MTTTPAGGSRRDFIKTTALAAAGMAVAGSATAQSAAAAGPRLKLGFDNFSVRALGLKAPGLIDLAAELKMDSLFITNLDALENFEDKYLADVKARAKDKEIDLWLGSWSICPTSKAFRKQYGTADEHLALGLRLAKALGSPVLRVVLGTRDDRRTDGGIEARIADTVKVLKGARSQALDAGIKIAVENHAGDMQAAEITQLIETAGKDYVGITFDSGNATWTLEDPLQCFEKLAPYVVATHLRDSMIWEYEEGVKVQWTAAGEGCTDMKKFFERYQQLCPGLTAHVEIISGFTVDFPVWKSGFWDVWPKAPAPDFARFLSLAKRGKPMVAAQANDKDYQRAELERSVKYCKDVIGIGRKV